MSKRYSGLWRDTWFLWVCFVVAGIALGILVHFIFYLAIPISFFAFFYFGTMRYDDEGNPKEGL